MTAPAPRLSGVRTFLLVGLAVVWFAEGVLTGVQPLAERWTVFWKMLPAGDPTLAAALYITHAFEAPLKAGLLVLALCAIWSKNPAVRTPLFLSMSLVPPINIAFHFRAQGFPVVSMTIATTLSLILWGSFLLTREPEPAAQPRETARGSTSSRAWFGISATVMTLLGLSCLLAPAAALYAMFPCLSPVFDSHRGELDSLRVSLLGAGSHQTALAAAGWFATARYRTNRALRQAVALSSITCAALMCALPLRLIVLQEGWPCARSLVLVPYIVLLTGWLLYAAAGRTRGDL